MSPVVSSIPSSSSLVNNQRHHQHPIMTKNRRITLSASQTDSLDVIERRRRRRLRSPYNTENDNIAAAAAAPTPINFLLSSLSSLPPLFPSLIDDWKGFWKSLTRPINEMSPSQPQPPPTTTTTTTDEAIPISLKLPRLPTFDWKWLSKLLNFNKNDETTITTTATLTTTTMRPLDKPIPSGQVQLPLLERIVRGAYEESLPWLLSLLPPTILSLLLHSPLPLAISASLELLFLAICSIKIHFYYSKPTLPEPLLPQRSWPSLRDSLWNGFSSIDDRRRFVMGWFYDVPFERLRREDAISYLVWMRYGTLPSQLSFRDLQEIQKNDLITMERMVNGGEALPDRGEGEEALPCLRFNLEPLRYRHKPLVFYGITHALKEVLTVGLGDLGFRYVNAKRDENGKKMGLGYWYRPASTTADDATTTTTTSTPLVFFHGVGGLVFYYTLIMQLANRCKSAAAMILFDLPFVSLRISDDIPSITQQIESVCQTLDKTVGNETKATFVGHSFGSIVLSWMVQSRPERVANCVFLDPICFQLHLKDTLFNFHLTRVDQDRQNGKAWENPFSIGALVNLAGTEMHTNRAMLRQFSWATNALWPSDLKRNGISASILLSENDEIVPTPAVMELLLSSSTNKKLSWKSVLSWSTDIITTLVNRRRRPSFTRTKLLPKATHGEFAFNDEHREKVVRTVLSMMRCSDIRQAKDRKRQRQQQQKKKKDNEQRVRQKS